MRQVVILHLGSATESHLAFLQSYHAYTDTHALDWDIRLYKRPKAVPPEALLITHHGRHSDWPDLPSNVRAGHIFSRQASWSSACFRFAEADFGRLAADHFHERGYRHCLILSSPRSREKPIDRQRLQGFTSRCAERQIRLQTFTHASPDEDDALCDLLLNHHAPLGVYGTTDGQVAWIRQLLRHRHGHLPDHLALLGTGNHVVTCLENHPTLSSVSYPWRLMGNQAALWTHQYLQHQTAPQPIAINPYRVASRESTPFIHIKDSTVTNALRWLRKHLSTQQPLHDVSLAMGCSPETMCRRFKKALGRSPQKLHAQFRMEEATRLLADDGLSMASIAKRCGFTKASIFSHAFRRYNHCTPTEWRQAAIDS